MNIRVKVNYIKEKIKRTIFYKIYSQIKRSLSSQTQEDISKKEIKYLIKKDNPTILEIGCNDGKDSLEFLNQFKDIKLFCFEPDPRSIKKFNMKINDSRCCLNEIALSNKKGKIDFFLSESEIKEGEGADSSSLKKPKEHLEKFPWIKFKDKISVATDTLDNWTKKNKIDLIDFIWADVQGAEKELIEGGIKTLNKKTKYLYTEFYEKELYEGQIGLKKILEMLPNYKIIKIYGNNVLLINTMFGVNL